MPTLGQDQERFSIMLGQLLTFAAAKSIPVRCLELFRPPEVYGKWGESKGNCHPRSLHKLKLAIDLRVPNDSLHEVLHDYWDSIGGSERILNDMNHYSLSREGMR